mmetsp:Transcript_15553/g.32934  ORF Transcript_15553/g.32934 Transcript_15553/m.32934 type:complete len:548 (-) Transcript_15553:231-1874(-)
MKPEPSAWVAEALEAHRAALQKHLETEHTLICAQLSAYLSAEFNIPPVNITTKQFVNSAVLASREASQSRKEQRQALEEPPVLNDMLVSPTDPPPGPQDEAQDGEDIVLNDAGRIMGEETVESFEKVDSKCARMSLRQIVSSPWFEATFCFFILLNTLTMAFEAQFRGLRIGVALGMGGSVEDWSGARRFLEHCGIFWGVLFTVEVVIKMVGLRFSFFRISWNWFDLAIVIVWIIDKLNLVKLPFGPMILRLFRLARLLRLLRLLKMSQVFDSLHLLTGSIRACGSILLWSMVLLLTVMIVCALCLNHLVKDFLIGEKHSLDARYAVAVYYGTTSRCIFTMFEITFGNFVPPARVLTENITEWYGVLFIVYRCVVGFAMLAVITGVFMQQTFKTAATSFDLMIIEKARQKREHLQMMNRFLKIADGSNDGVISWPEFSKLLQDDAIKLWLQAMGLEVSDGLSLFQLLSKGDGKITSQELVEGVASLKGGARSIDLHKMMTNADRMERLLMRIDKQLGMRTPGVPGAPPQRSPELHQCVAEWLHKADI